MDSIKFTQKLNDKFDVKNVTTQNIGVNNSVSLAKNQERESIIENKIDFHEQMAYFPNIISTYMSMLNNIRFYGWGWMFINNYMGKIRFLLLKKKSTNYFVKLI